jgi:hypothetical protein
MTGGGAVYYVFTALSLALSGIIIQHPELEPYKTCLNVFNPQQVYSKSLALWASLKTRWMLDDDDDDGGGYISSTEITLQRGEAAQTTNLIDYKPFQGQIVINDVTGKMYTLSPLPVECNVRKGV